MPGSRNGLLGAHARLTSAGIWCCSDFRVNGATWTLLIEFLAVPLMLGRIFALPLDMASLGLLALSWPATIAVMLFFPGRRIPAGPHRTSPSSSMCIYVFIVGLSIHVSCRECWLPNCISETWLRVDSSDCGKLGLAVSAHRNVQRSGRCSVMFRAGRSWSRGIGMRGDRRHPRASSDSVCAFTRFLETPPVKFLGRISYSFYLYHATALLSAWALHRWLLPPGIDPLSWLGGAILLLWCITATAAMAWVSYVAVERPMMRLGRRL